MPVKLNLGQALRTEGEVSVGVKWERCEMGIMSRLYLICIICVCSRVKFFLNDIELTLNQTCFLLFYYTIISGV